MNLLLQVILYGLFANCVFSVSVTYSSDNNFMITKKKF